jgi:cytochrome o ubiquinol oxidase subunit 3
MGANLQKNQHDDTKSFGFWLYLMTDAVLFASFFAVFAVLRDNTYGGPSGRDIFDMKFVLAESVILLASSFVCGLALLYARKKDRSRTLTFLVLTGLLGLAFIGMELYEFNKLIADGESWRASGFLSAFFGLVGLHGLHILAGILWLSTMLVLTLKRGLIDSTVRRLELFSVYWHFLDIIWIFIFTFVYGMGVIG